MLKELKTQHRNIIQMSFSGFKNKEIAEKLEMAESTISSVLRSPLGQAYIGGLHDKAKENTLDVRKQLISMNVSALDAFERILCPHNKVPYNVQFSTAKDILDRNGFKPTDKINIDMTLQSKSDAEIDAEITAMQNSIARASKATAELESIEESSENLPDKLSHNLLNSDPDQLSEDSSINLEIGPTLADLSIDSSDKALELESIDRFPPK